jgi:hypothetical protein
LQGERPEWFDLQALAGGKSGLTCWGAGQSNANNGRGSLINHFQFVEYVWYSGLKSLRPVLRRISTTGALQIYHAISTPAMYWIKHLPNDNPCGNCTVNCCSGNWPFV